MNWGIMYSRSVLSVTKRHALLYMMLFSATGFASERALAYSPGEFQQVITSQEAKIDNFRDQEIRQLQLVLSRAATREMQPDLMLRLAELYTEKYRLYFNKENEIWSKKMDAYLAMSPGSQKASRRPQIENNVSRQWLGKAVQVLQGIPLQKGRYERLEEVYYFLGFNLWELGKKKESVKNFEEIVKQFPKGRFAAEAYRYIGDFAFAARDFDKSQAYYERAARFESSPARPRVLYGLAWSQFKQREYRKSVATMADAIRLGKSGVGEKQGLALQRDAADSLALFYSEGGSLEGAAGFFNDLFGEAEGAVVLRKLAVNYQKQGKYAKALAINKQLISMGGAAARQGDEQRYEIMVDGHRIAATKGDRAREAALLKSMTAEFVTNAKEPQEERVEQIRSQVKKLALLSHKEGNKTKNPREAYGRAEDLYRLYLSAFSKQIKEDEVAEIRYYLADVLSQTGRYGEAAAEFRAIVDEAQDNAVYKKYQKDSATGMVYALDNYFKAKGAKKDLSKADADQVIGAIDTYVRLYPNDKDTTKYLARAAGILVTGKRMDEARPRLMQLIEKYSGSREAWDAAATMLKEAEDEKNYQEAERLSKLYLANRGLMAQDSKGEFKKRLESIASRAVFEQVKKVEESKDFDDAAAGYEKLAASAKDPEVRNKALNNAAVSYARAGDRANELRIYFRILDLQPGNENAEKSILGVGNEHFLSGRYSEAADLFEKFYAAQEPRFKKRELKASSQKITFEALRSAALIRSALKQNEKASENFRKVVEAANLGVDAARSAAGDFLYDTAKRLRDEGNAPEAIRAFDQYYRSFPGSTHANAALLAKGQLYAKLREEEKAQATYGAVLQSVKRGSNNPEDLAAGAQARLELLAPLEAAFEKAPLRLPEAQLKQDINNKLQALDRLNKGYIEVMDFGDGTWGVEAFRRMALAYRNFAQKLESAPVPAEFSPEDKAKFRAQLKNVAAPVYLKVGETLETALRKGETLQVVGPVMARVYLMAVLLAARPDRYPLVQFVSWDKAQDWIMGEAPTGSDLDQKRNSLRTRPDDASAWVAIGNSHMLRGEEKLAEIFYLHALDKNPKHPAALNNLAYIKGKAGDMTRAMAGFKAALSHDEFAVPPKKNMSRLQAASGLWRHASLNYRQLEVRVPNDREVKRGLALSYLATGKVSQAEADSGLIGSGEGDNGRFAEAVLALARGDRNKAASGFESLAGRNEMAKLILEFWNTKENN